MTEHDKNKRVLPMQKVVHCHRTGREFDLGKHLACPYCYGDEKEVASGEHERFCDFKPGGDPVSFGFPGSSSRLDRG
jgi:hypothetical protein